MSENVVVTQKNILSRLGSSIKGILGGLLLAVAAFPLLFWNEGRAVSTRKSLEEGAASVISVPADAVAADNEGKLVHASAPVVVEESIVDPVFGVEAAEAVGLRRTVEMYQWVERSESKTTTKVGGTEETVTTYSYAKEWSSSLRDSSRFHNAAGHENPSSIPYGEETFVPASARFGAFTLGEEILARFTGFAPLAVAADALEALPEGSREDGLSVHEGGFYRGESPAAPAVGDVRVRFEKAAAGQATLVGKQRGQTFESYTTSNGGSIFFVVSGERPAAELFEEAIAGNETLTWVLRVVGFFVMFFGFGMVLKPLSVLASVIPFMGRIVGVGTSIVAFLLAAPLSLLTVALAWLFYRPLIGVPLLVLSLGLGYLLVKKLKGAKAPELAAAPEPAV